jgi:sugar phosphate permease
MKKPILIPWLICGLGALFYCYEYFLRISPSVMTPELMKAYHLTGAQFGSLSAYFYHAYVLMQIIVGLFMDRYGPRRLLTVACLFCALGSFLFASGHSLAIAELGRFCVGFGYGFGFVGALKLATIWLPPNRFALISGIILCLGMIGAMIGDVLLRVLVDDIGWKATVYSSGAVGLGLAVLLSLLIRDVNPDNHNMHMHVATNFKGLIAGLFGSVKNPQIWLNGLMGFLLYMSLSVFAEAWGISYLTQAYHLTKTHAAEANAMVFLGWAVGGPFWGWFSDYIRRRSIPILAGSFFSLILVSVLLYANHLSLPITYFILFGFGFFSSVQILVFAICREVSSIKVAGTSIALTNMIVMLGGNLFQPVIGKLLDMQWHGTLVNGARMYPAAAYEIALTVLPVCLVLAVIISFFIKETHCKIQVNQR